MWLGYFPPTWESNKSGSPSTMPRVYIVDVFILVELVQLHGGLLTSAVVGAMP